MDGPPRVACLDTRHARGLSGPGQVGSRPHRIFMTNPQLDKSGPNFCLKSDPNLLDVDCTRWQAKEIANDTRRCEITKYCSPSGRHISVCRAMRSLYHRFSPS